MKKLLKRFFKYTKKVYRMQEKINAILDPRNDARIPISSVCFTLFLAFCFRIESFNQLNGWVRKGYVKKLVPRGTRIPYIDTIRRVLTGLDVSSFIDIHRSIIHKARKNHVFRKTTINGLSVVAIDGVELFCSKEKSCEECLTRTTKDGKTEFYHQAVVCMGVGAHPRICLGMEMLHPKKDGSEEDEGELTGAKRLVENLCQSFRHFADVIAVDALYMNQPFLSLVLSRGIDVVVRMKDERLLIMKDARGLFENREPNYIWEEKMGNQTKQVEVWQDRFSFGDLDHPLSVYRFRETIKNAKKEDESKEIWVATSLDRNSEEDAKMIRRIIHKRWDIENCAFHQLKTYWNINHCFVHQPNAIVAILWLILIVFNLFHIFIFCSVHHFDQWNMTRKEVIEDMKFQAFSGTVGILWSFAPP
jgi:hypothetical protein